MAICRAMARFGADEGGAVTVDWVVLTGALVGLAIGIVTTVEGGVMHVADSIAHMLGTHIHADGRFYE